MSLSNYGENYVLDLYLEQNLWVGLSTADPGEDAAALAEPSGNGYARVAVTAATWDAASGGSKDNGTAITFPEASGSWGELAYVCLFDAVTSGNLLESFALTSPQTITTGQIARFSAAALAFTLA